VSGLLTHLDNLEREQVDALIEGSTRWTYGGDETTAECFECDWTQSGGEDVVIGAADAHMLSQHPTPELRLVRSHRQIIEQYQEAQGRVDRFPVEDQVRLRDAFIVVRAYAQGLKASVVSLAEGWGVGEVTQ
jgi:hypothetical protein